MQKMVHSTPISADHHAALDDDPPLDGMLDKPLS